VIDDSKKHFLTFNTYVHYYGSKEFLGDFFGICSKALQKTEFSELFVFAGFQLSKFGNFSEISGFFELAKILQRKVWKKFGNKNSEINSNIIQIYTSNTKLSNKTT
jgi:hypothetical protein